MCLKHLYSNGYSTNLRTALMGKSAGGLPVAVLLNRKPDIISSAVLQVSILTHFRLMYHFYTPRKHQKISRFFLFLGSIETEL